MDKLFEGSKENITRLILVRHGQTLKNAQSRIGIIDETPLDKTGIKQANSVAERLQQFSVNALMTSPVTRAKQTAEIISHKLKIDYEVRDELREYFMGAISGLTIEEMKENLPEDYDNFQSWVKNQPSKNIERPQYSDAEPIENIEKRVHNFVDYIFDNYEKQVVCAVTHLAMIKGFLATLFGRSVHKPMNFFALNTSLTIIDFERNTPILMLFNDTNHLDNGLFYGKVTLL